MKRRSILAATLGLGHVPAILWATAIANGAVSNNPRTLSSEAKAAYERKDFATFVAKMKEALALRPTHQTHLYNLAVGYALTGHDADALELLSEAASIGYTYPGMEKDPDWQNLRGKSEFETVSQRLAANAAPVARSATALTIHEKGIVSEGLAYDPETGTFFIGSVYARKILAVDKAGVAQDFSVKEDGLWSVLGMKFDARRRALWACTSAQPQMSKADPREDGAAAICKYDLRTRKLVQKFLLPRDSAKHLLGDLAVASSGDVYATDSLNPIIYRIRADGKEIETFLVSDEFVNLQGLAFSPDEKQLLVADYSKGLFRIDLASKDCLNLQPLGHSTLMGLDGLYAVGDGSYIAVQNGTTPNRILRILLSPEARKVESLSVLESNNPIWDEPTLGVIAEGAFYYNGASQWGAVSEKGEIAPPEKLRDAIVQRLPL